MATEAIAASPGPQQPVKQHIKSLTEFELRDGQRPLAIEWLEEVAAFYTHLAVDNAEQKAARPGASDVLEMLVVGSAVDLAPNLGHFLQSVRHSATLLYLKLAAVFDRTFAVQAAYEQVVKPGGRSYTIQTLITLVHRALAPMLIGFVTGLESLYMHADHNVRDVAVVCVTTLVHCNSDLLVVQDNLSSVWNIVFLLDLDDDNASRWQVTGTRVAIIASLDLLASHYCSRSASLTIDIITKLLAIPTISSTEAAAARTAISNIIAEITRRPPDELVAEREGDGERSPGRRRHGGATVADAYTALVKLLTGRCEAHYDQVAVATRTLTSAAMAANPGGAPPPETVRFIENVMVVMTALSPTLVRYGAAIMVSATLDAAPELVDRVPDLYPIVVNRCCDVHLVTRNLHLHILMQIATCRKLHSLVDLLHSFEQRHHQHHSRPVTLSDVVAEAVMYGANILPRQLTALLGSTRCMPLAAQLDNLDLVRHWASRATELDANLIQQLLPMLQTGNTRAQAAVLAIFRALKRALPTMSKSLLRSSETYFRQLLCSDDDACVLLALEVLSMFPLHELPVARLHRLLVDHLAPKAFAPTSSTLRQAVYTVLASCRRFWTSNDLACAALAILVVGIGDVDPVAAFASLRGFLDVSSGPQWKSAASTSAFHALLLKSAGLIRHPDLHVRLGAYNQIVSAMTTWADPEPLFGVIGHLVAGGIADLVRARLFAMATDSVTMRADVWTHLPNWYVLLFSRLRVPIRIGTADVPVERALRPLLASNNRVVRAAAVDTAIKVCFLGARLLRDIADAAIADAVDALIDGAAAFVQDSALAILDGLARRHIPRLNVWLTTRLLGTLTDMLGERALANAKGRPAPGALPPKAIVRLIETLLLDHLANPTAANRNEATAVLAANLDHLRNATRQMLTTSSAGADRLYVVVARCAATLPANVYDATAYFEFLMGDIEPLLAAGADPGDPLMANLTKAQRHLVGRVSIRAMGSCGTPASLAMVPKFLADLTPFLCHPNYEFRRDATSAVFGIADVAAADMPSDVRASMASALWQVLPLLADSDIDVRVEVRRGIQAKTLSLPSSPTVHLVQSMRAPASSLALEATAPPPTALSFACHDAFDLGAPADRGASRDDDADDDYEAHADAVMNPPPINRAFVDQVRALIGNERVVGDVGAEAEHTADRLLRFLSSPTGFAASAAVVVSELAGRISDESREALADRLCAELDRQIAALPTDRLAGFAIALGTFAQAAPVIAVHRVVEYVVGRAGAGAGAHDGLVHALHAVLVPVAALHDLAEIVAAAQARALVDQVRRILSEQATTRQTKHLALELLVLLGAICDSGSPVVQQLVDLIDDIDDAEFHDYIVAAARPMLRAMALGDPVLRALQDRLDGSAGVAVDPVDQQRRLTLLALLSENQDPQAVLGHVVALLADTDVGVRRRAVRMVVNGALGEAIRASLTPILEGAARRDDAAAGGDLAGDRKTSMRVARQRLSQSLAFRMRTSVLRAFDYSRAAAAVVSSSGGDLVAGAYRSDSASGIDDDDDGDLPAPMSIADADPLNARYLASERYSSIAARYHSSLIYNVDNLIVDDAHGQEDSVATNAPDEAFRLGRVDDDNDGSKTGIATVDEDGDEDGPVERDDGAVGARPPDLSTVDAATALKAAFAGAGQAPHPVQSASPGEPLGNAPADGAPGADGAAPAGALSSLSSSEPAGAAMSTPARASATSSATRRPSSPTGMAMARDGHRARLRRESTRSSLSLAAATMRQELAGGDAHDDPGGVALGDDLIAAMTPDQLQTMLSATIASNADSARVLLDKLLAAMEAPGVTRADLKTKAHTMGVLVNLIASFAHLDDGTDAPIARLRTLCTDTRTRCAALRAAIIAAVDQQLAPIVTTPADEERAAARAAAQVEAAGDPQKRAAMIRAAQDEQARIEADNRLLATLTTLTLEMVKGFGRMYAYLKVGDPERFASGVEFLIGILGDEHEVVRKVARDCITQVVRARDDDDTVDLSLLYERLAEQLIGSLQSDAQANRLRRSKADLCAALASILPRLPVHATVGRERALHLILSMWDDDDVAVRNASIDMVRLLGSSYHVPELEAMMDPTSSSGTSTLMNAVMTRLNADGYASKEKLQTFMEWLFSRR